MEELIKQLLGELKGPVVLKPEETGLKAPLLVMPSGLGYTALTEGQATPERIDGVVQLHRVVDFAEYVNAFKADGARIFVEPRLEFTKGGILATAYLDYPLPGTPAWSTHRAQLVVSPSLEYQLLTNLAEKGLHAQADFARSLRDVSRFCSSQSSADLLEMAQTLTLTSAGSFADVQDEFSGSVRFGYDVKVKATSEATQRRNAEIPQNLTFNLPVLQGGGAFDLVADFLYRVPDSQNDKVRLGIRLPDRAFVERAVLESVVDQLNGLTGLVVALGSTTVPTKPEGI